MVAGTAREAVDADRMSFMRKNRSRRHDVRFAGAFGSLPSRTGQRRMRTTEPAVGVSLRGSALAWSAHVREQFLVVRAALPGTFPRRRNVFTALHSIVTRTHDDALHFRAIIAHISCAASESADDATIRSGGLPA
jgi:hypothetical protein